MHPDVTILGGGVIGLTTAYELARRHVRVRLLERGELGRESSWAGAGIVPPGDFQRATGPIHQLRAYSSERFGPLSDELREFTGIDNEFHRCGGIEFLPLQDPSPMLWQAEGIAYERLADADLQRRGLTPRPREAWFLPGMGQVRNPRHVHALAVACERLGVELRPHSEVVSWQRTGERITRLTLADGSTQSPNRVLLASGAWSEKFLTALGIDSGIRPVRGQMALFQTVPGRIPNIVLWGKRYMVPRRDGHILVGSTEEPHVGFTPGTTPEAVADLTAIARSRVPALAEASPVRAWSGFRPGSVDGLPLLGPIPGFVNAFVAAGHFRAGIQLSPGTGRLLAEVLTDTVPMIPLDVFRPGRPPVTDFCPAFRS